MMKITNVVIEECGGAGEMWGQREADAVGTSIQDSLRSTRQNNKTAQRKQRGQLNDSKIYLHMT